MKVALALLALLALALAQQHLNDFVSTARVPCPLDVVFVMDSSGSMQEEGWAAAKAFANRIVDTIPMANNQAQFAFVQFGDTLGTVFNLLTYTNAEAVKTAINGVNLLGGGTNTHLGLDEAGIILTFPGFGARASADKLVILLTDGKSNNSQQTTASAATLRADGVKILAVGAGPNIDEDELEEIAGEASQVLQTINVATSHQDDFIYNQITKNMDCVPCPLDVVFVMDSSGSMKEEGWAAAKEFANRIVDAVPVGVGKAQFAFVQFATSLGTVFDLHTYTNADDLKTAINGVDYLGNGGWTMTHKGLDKANEILFDSGYGARASADKLVILLTDGRSTNSQLTMASAATLRANGVKIVAVGAGSNIDEDELEGIAGVASQVLETTDVDTVHQDDFIHDQIVEHLDCVSCPLDVVFVMDSSGSMGTEGWAAAKEFANRIVDSVPVGADDVQFAFVQFGSSLGTVFDLDEYTNADDLQTEINGVDHLAAGSTNTHLGLNMAGIILTFPGFGARASADNLVILLTDGKSNNQQQTIASAATLRANGVKILAVGAGPSIEVAELEGIAGDASQVLQTTDVDTVHQDDFIRDQIVEHLDCTRKTDQTQTPWSGHKDDDTSVATCQKDYHMVGCECESLPNRDDCDGARIRDDATGSHCVAYNMNGGKGVLARPRCLRVMITSETTVTDMPSIRCPENYKLTGCTMHSSIRHNLWQDPANPGGKHPVSKRGGGLCYTSSGCSSCSVQARCIRVKSLLPDPLP